MIVGPSHVVAHLPGRMGLRHYDSVMCQKPNAWLAYAQTLKEAYRVWECNHNPVILVSMGLPAKVLIHDLHMLCGHRTSIWDCGAIWDIWCNKRSRGVYNQLKDWTHRIRMSLNEA